MKQTDDQSAMTRRSETGPNEDRDGQFVFRKKRKMISRSMIGEHSSRKGASWTRSDEQKSSGDWTKCGLGTETRTRKRTRGKPPTNNAFGLETRRQTSGGWTRKRKATPIAAQRELFFGMAPVFRWGLFLFGCLSICAIAIAIIGSLAQAVAPLGRQHQSHGDEAM